MYVQLSKRSLRAVDMSNSADSVCCGFVVQLHYNSAVPDAKEICSIIIKYTDLFIFTFSCYFVHVACRTTINHYFAVIYVGDDLAAKWRLQTLLLLL